MGIPSFIHLFFSLKTLKDIIHYIMLHTTERAMKIISLLLVIYVVFQTMELPVF